MAEGWKAAVRRLFAGQKAVRAALVLGICGILLLFLTTPGGQRETAASPAEPSVRETQSDYAAELEQRLEELVSAITGEPSPTVLVTLASNGRSVYSLDETSESRAGETDRRESAHVVLKAADGAQQPLTVTRLEPEIRGVVVVSRRGEDPVIRERLTQAVKTALHLSSARVFVTGNQSIETE